MFQFLISESQKAVTWPWPYPEFALHGVNQIFYDLPDLVIGHDLNSAACPIQLQMMLYLCVQLLFIYK